MEKIIYKKLNTLDDSFYQRLKQECYDVISKVGWNNGLNQIMLQTLNPNVDDFVTGTGKLSIAPNKYEPAYNHIQPSLKGTVLDDFLSSMNVFRTRLMLSKSRTCYSVHKDVSVRLHIALETNNQAYFLFPEQNQFHHIPEDKSIHFVDTRMSHSFANCGLQDRVHLVMCTNVLPFTG